MKYQMPTLAVRCSCESSFQDATYGKNVRVATPANKSRVQGKLMQVSCTVCGRAHSQFTGDSK